jgi:hypothetical protein
MLFTLLPALRRQDFGEHGREYITSEVALRLLATLTDPAALAALLGGSSTRLERLQAILSKTVLKVTSPQGPGSSWWTRVCLPSFWWP